MNKQTRGRAKISLIDSEYIVSNEVSKGLAETLLRDKVNIFIVSKMPIVYFSRHVIYCECDNDLFIH